MPDKNIDNEQWQKIGKIDKDVAVLHAKIEGICQGIDEIKNNTVGLNGIKADVKWHTWAIRLLYGAMVTGFIGIVYVLVKTR